VRGFRFFGFCAISIFQLTLLGAFDIAETAGQFPLPPGSGILTDPADCEKENDRDRSNRDKHFPCGQLSDMHGMKIFTRVLKKSESQTKKSGRYCHV